MGIFLNPGPSGFQQALNSEIYVDKTGMIGYLNKVFATELKYVCVSRPRRFGKSMAARMIAAYYDRSVEQAELFRGLKITQDASFAQFAGKYDVLMINIQQFLSESSSMAEMLKLMNRLVSRELERAYPDLDFDMPDRLIFTMGQIYAETGRQFVIVIDEWDCIFREYKSRKDEQETYLDFLRNWLKDRPYVGLAYMTGILPIKKYGTHSALNMFREFSMTAAEELASYVGFTEEEVRKLCEEQGMDFAEAKAWYDGYRLLETLPKPWQNGVKERSIEIYNPRSLVVSMMSGAYRDYWNETERFEALRDYIVLNYDGLHDAVVELMAGAEKRIDIRSFTNEMDGFHGYQDVLTLLVHLGYLGYDAAKKSVFIPNKELMDEYVTSTTVSKWSEIVNSIQHSEQILQATWDGEAGAVAQGIENAHFETSHIQYHDENALSYVLSLAYYAARQYYHIIRELPTGKGFADLAFIPRQKYAEKPAMIAELKWDKGADTAIRQIKEKRYAEALKDWNGKLLLVGISYDKQSRVHSCEIEACAGR